MSKIDAKINKEMLMLVEEQAPKIEFNLKKSKEKKLTIPRLPYDVQVEILARASCSEYWKFSFLNKQFANLLRSRQIFRIRQKCGIEKPYVLMLTSNQGRWIMFDQDFKSLQKLHKTPSDFSFSSGDKETLCVGRQLIVVGRETKGVVVWRYELEARKWFKDPNMITPRSMFGSASRGRNAFFAGGIKTNEDGDHEVVNVVEKYNADTKTWTEIRGMHKKRQFSAACFLHGKFYVIGGRDENNRFLSCGECYNEVMDSWELIPDMIKDMPTPLSPPLIAVVNDNLYMLDTVSNGLNVYDIDTNAWKQLGVTPVRANSLGGFGIAFKSMGDRLLLIGTTNFPPKKMSVFTCLASTNAEDIIWEKSDDSYPFSSYIYNCCVMFA